MIRIGADTRRLLLGALEASAIWRPPFSLVQWAENRHGILFSPGYTSMGETESSILLFGPVGSAVTEIATIAETGYDNCVGEQNRAERGNPL